MNEPSKEEIARAEELLARNGIGDVRQRRELATAVLLILQNTNYVIYGIAGPEDEE